MRTPAVPRSFTSPRGHRFTVRHAHSENGRWGPEHAWEIRFRGKKAGTLYCDSMYAAPNAFHASTRQLFWTYASEAPTGIGFDVGGHASAAAALRAWARSADEILDWHSGRPVSTPWSGGVQSRGVRSRDRRRRVRARRDSSRHFPKPEFDEGFDDRVMKALHHVRVLWKPPIEERLFGTSIYVVESKKGHGGYFVVVGRKVEEHFEGRGALRRAVKYARGLHRKLNRRPHRWSYS